MSSPSDHDHGDFEDRLRRQPQARLDPTWREGILSAARAELVGAEGAVARTSTPAARPLLSPWQRWWREWLPMPMRVPLAAAWLLIAFLGFSAEWTETDAPLSDGASSAQQPSSEESWDDPTAASSPITYLALRQRWTHALGETGSDFSL